MPTTTEIPDLSGDQLAALSDKMAAAKAERDARERAERGRQQMVRQSKTKLRRVTAELETISTEEDTKLRAVADLRERLEAIEGQNEHDPAVQAERAALVSAIEMATEKGAPVTSGVTCPANTREFRLLYEGAPRGTAWAIPIADLQRRRKALTAERDRLQAQVD